MHEVAETSADSSAIRQLKRLRGCQHPCHSHMPYAPLFMAPVLNPTHIGTLHISHLRRGDGTIRNQLMKSGNSRISFGLGLRDLEEGIAEVHCRFCHKLYTLCENKAMFSGAIIDHDYDVLQRECPSFIQHFEQATNGYDWDAERRRISKAQSVAQSICNNVQTKRKPTDAEIEHIMRKRVRVSLTGQQPAHEHVANAQERSDEKENE